jgi:hypothetical protein
MLSCLTIKSSSKKRKTRNDAGEGDPFILHRESHLLCHNQPRHATRSRKFWIMAEPNKLAGPPDEISWSSGFSLRRLTWCRI